MTATSYGKMLSYDFSNRIYNLVMSAIDFADVRDIETDRGIEIIVVAYREHLIYVQQEMKEGMVADVTKCLPRPILNGILFSTAVAKYH